MNAAHCVRGAVVSNFRVVAGEHSLSTVSGDEQDRGVTRYTMHESYNANTFANDISLIFVSLVLNLLYIDNFTHFIQFLDCSWMLL